MSLGLLGLPRSKFPLSCHNCYAANSRTADERQETAGASTKMVGVSTMTADASKRRANVGCGNPRRPASRVAAMTIVKTVVLRRLLDQTTNLVLSSLFDHV